MFFNNKTYERLTYLYHNQKHSLRHFISSTHSASKAYPHEIFQ